MKEMLLHKIYQRPLTERIIFLFAIDCDKTIRRCARLTIQVNTELNSKNSLTTQVKNLVGAF
jgi:hypothetical protein